MMTFRQNGVAAAAAFAYFFEFAYFWICRDAVKHLEIKGGVVTTENSAVTTKFYHLNR